MTVDERIEVVPYDPCWPAWFAADADELRAALGQSLVALEHFGSTAVPSLAGKPIIDILVAPKVWPLPRSEREVLAHLGYEYLGEAGVPGREYLRRRTAHSTNLAVVPHESPRWRDNLAFRDYLRSHAQAAQAYGETKRAAWEQGARTLLDYSRAKREVVAQLLTEACAWQREK